MLPTLRIGMRIGTNDPYWVQIRDAVYRRAQQLGIELVPIDIGRSSNLDSRQPTALADALTAQDLAGLMCSFLPAPLLLGVLERGIPVVHLTETDVVHPLLIASHGYFEIAQLASRFLVKQIGGRGHVLLVGGLLAKDGEDGRSRIAGAMSIFEQYPDIHTMHVPSAWRYEHAIPQIEEALRSQHIPFDGVFGLSDSVALAARDAARSLFLLKPTTASVGINGDPLALASIAEGTLTATVDTAIAEFAAHAVTLARDAARGMPVPQIFGYAPRLVTAQTVSQVAMKKLIDLAELPNRLVGVNRDQESQRLAQLETSLAINQRIGAILDRQQLSQEIIGLIRTNYSYDLVQLFLYDEQEQMLVLDQPGGMRLALADSGALGATLRWNEPVFVPDAQHSQRFPPDPRWPRTYSRVVLPVRIGQQTLGLLDLHSHGPMQHSRQTLAGLQALADQLGIAMRNADLYAEALAARTSAEKANQLKTRLLANVSHELRAPLNVILGYSQAALDQPNPYSQPLPTDLRRDIERINHSGQHLIRLINDLLDLSRAEIDELDLFPEPVDTRAFLEEVFQNATLHHARDEIDYTLDLPPELPMIQADPLRLRQVLLNLLGNARKFTNHGFVALGAEIAPPYLHLWVADSGTGIPIDLQEEIFEPFVSAGSGDTRRQGVGLGLTISRRLVALHKGTMTLESQPGRGSTFHVYLPLPSLDGQISSAPEHARRALLLLGAAETPPRAILQICQRQQLMLCHLRPGDDLAAQLAGAWPAAVALDLGSSSSADWALLELVRGNQQICRAPFLLYNADTLPTAETSIGGVGVLSKPFSNNGLLELIGALRQPSSVGPILIADDDAQTRDMYAQLIANAQINLPVRLANGGQQALDILAYETPSLVILDLMMPDIDGFTVLEHLRAGEHTRHVPVIVISGHLLSRQDIERLDYPLVAFQSKGILSQEELAAAVQQARNHEYLARPTSLLVKRALGYIQKHYAADISRQDMAEAVGVSKNYLTQIFQEETGISPLDYLNRYRIAQAKHLLQNEDLSIAGVAAQVGFDDAGYFARVFRKHTGCTPQAFRRA